MVHLVGRCIRCIAFFHTPVGIRKAKRKALMHLSTTYSCSQLEHAPSIYIHMPCTPYRVTYMLDISFSTYCHVAKLQIVSKYNPIA